MTRNLAGTSFVMALAAGLWTAASAPAIQVPFNLVQSQSTIMLNGDYLGTAAAPVNPFTNQDNATFPTPGTTDNDPTRPSNQTNLFGTITVDVDNILAPTTIQIISASMDAVPSGSWLPEVQPDQGAPSEDNPPDPAMPADLAIKLVAFECCDFAYATIRDINFTLVSQTLDPDDNGPLEPTPVVEPVNPQGEFSSYSQHLSYASGFFDYWLDPFSGNERERDDNTGDGGQNQHVFFNDSAPGETITPIPNAPKSTYTVAGNLATLTIPINIDFDQPGDLSQYYDGLLVATYEIPSGPDGDYNEDGIVNAADYPAWRKIPSAFSGDPLGYNAWVQQFGEAGAGAGGSGSVPEPAGLAFVVFGFSAWLITGGRCGR